MFVIFYELGTLLCIKNTIKIVVVNLELAEELFRTPNLLRISCKVFLGSPNGIVIDLNALFGLLVCRSLANACPLWLYWEVGVRVGEVGAPMSMSMVVRAARRGFHRQWGRGGVPIHFAGGMLGGGVAPR